MARKWNFYKMNFISSDTFSSVAHYSILTREEEIDLSQFQSNKIIYCNTHRLYELQNILRDNKNKFILITHGSDYNIEYCYIDRMPKCIHHWFAQNCLVNHKQVTPIPIGVFPKERNGDQINPYLITKFNEGYKEEYLLHYNVCINTNLGERERAYEASKQISDSLVYLNERFTHNEFYDNMSKCKFVISPYGYGVDCFRTWEAIYMGKIPIVKKNYMNWLFSSLFPMIMVDTWEELRYMEKTLRELDYNTIYNNYEDNWRQKYLNETYWKKMILSKYEEIKC